MPNWIRVGRSQDIPAGACRVIDAEGRSVAVFNIGGAFHAIDNACAHQGGPLGEGSLDGTIVTCPWHHWSYDVTTGRTTMSEEIGVKRYSIELREEDVYLDAS